MKNHVVLPLLLIAVMYAALAVNSNSLDTATFSVNNKKTLLDLLGISIFYYTVLSCNSILNAFITEIREIFKKTK
jgi:ABC-type spermidine/putrescine transport system permease subunit II